MLPVGDGNEVYFEQCGNPDGKPALVLHGGPGSGCVDGMRRFFDPDAYRMVLFDQRGCGRSLPSASDLATDMSVNTTDHLLGDIELLRYHLGIDAWLVLGFSWGSTLGIAYAERFRRRVSELVLVGVTMTRQSEIDWLYHGLARFLPEAWDKFSGAVGGNSEREIVVGYNRLLRDADPEVRRKAAKDWHDWEAASLSVDQTEKLPLRWNDETYRLARARIVTHYFRHRAWLEEGELLREAGQLQGLRGAMIQGQLDLAAPLITAWELSRVWSDADLIVVPYAGHSVGDGGMTKAVIATTERFR